MGTTRRLCLRPATKARPLRRRPIFGSPRQIFDTPSKEITATTQVNVATAHMERLDSSSPVFTTIAIVCACVTVKFDERLNDMLSQLLYRFIRTWRSVCV